MRGGGGGGSAGGGGGGALAAAEEEARARLSAVLAPVVVGLVSTHSERGDAQTCAVLTLLLRQTRLRSVLPREQQIRYAHSRVVPTPPIS